MDRLAARLFAPVDIASLVFFRIAFGAIMVWEVLRYFSHDWIRRYWIEPSFHFTYFGFDWVRPWPDDLMYWHFAALGILAALIGLGLFYRLATVLFFLGFTYVFLLDQARYLNHFYLISIVSFLMIFVPAHRALSLDALRCPEIRTDRVPAWPLWILRTQLALVYVFAGIAKLDPDWLRGEPMRSWLASRTDFPLIGGFFTLEPAGLLASYAALFLDLFVVPLLLWERTRPFAFAAAVAFHVMNARLFSIGIFPWFMIAATTLFFRASWPRFGLWPSLVDAAPPPAVRPARERLAIVAAIAIFLGVQILLPLRHWAYPGAVSWTEEGHRFSWHMLLRTKRADARFFATDPASGRTFEVDLRTFLTRDQIVTMRTRPDMILQAAHHIARDLERQGLRAVQVRAQVIASLNGRPEQALIDPSVDLAAQPRTLAPAAWILPLATDPPPRSPPAPGDPDDEE